MSPEIQIKNPTFEEYFNSLNVKAYGELEEQYKYLWNLYCTPMKSCYCNKSYTMFEAHRFFGNKLNNNSLWHILNGLKLF